MRKLLVSAAIALSFAVPAFAQGLPPEMYLPQYGTHAFPHEPYHNRTVFSELFGHGKNGNQGEVHTAEQTATHAKGS